MTEIELEDKVEIDFERMPIYMNFFLDRLNDLDNFKKPKYYHVKNAIFLFFNNKIITSEEIDKEQDRIIQINKFINQNIVFENCSLIFFGMIYSKTIEFEFSKYFFIGETNISFINPKKIQEKEYILEMFETSADKLKGLHIFNNNIHIKAITLLYLFLNDLIENEEVEYYKPENIIYVMGDFFLNFIDKENIDNHHIRFLSEKLNKNDNHMLLFNKEENFYNINESQNIKTSDFLKEIISNNEEKSDIIDYLFENYII